VRASRRRLKPAATILHLEPPMRIGTANSNRRPAISKTNLAKVVAGLERPYKDRARYLLPGSAPQPAIRTTEEVVREVSRFAVDSPPQMMKLLDTTGSFEARGLVGSTPRTRWGTTSQHGRRVHQRGGTSRHKYSSVPPSMRFHKQGREFPGSSARREVRRHHLFRRGYIETVRASWR